MGSGYVISKSEGHLAPLFLQFCKKYDICNLSQGALTGAFGKKYVGLFHIFNQIQDDRQLPVKIANENQILTV